MNDWPSERLDAAIAKLVTDMSSDRAKTIASDLRAQRELLSNREIAKALSVLKGLRDADVRAVDALSAFYMAGADRQKELSTRWDNVDLQEQRLAEQELRRREQSTAAMQALPEELLDIVILTDICHGITDAALGQALRISRETARDRRNSAQRQMRRYMARNRIEADSLPLNSPLAYQQQSGGHELILRPLRGNSRTPPARTYDDYRGDSAAEIVLTDERIPGLTASQTGEPDEMSIGTGNWNRREWSDDRRRENKQNMALAALKRQAQEDAAAALRVTLDELLSPEQLALLRNAVKEDTCG